MKVNLACGSIFVESDGWMNFDLSQAGAFVRRANLLARLPLAAGSVDAVYCYHFLEHIPREEVPEFLQECQRVLRAGGILRLLTLDLENICRAYLSGRNAEQDEKAQFVVLELVDQCVRRRTGGLIGQKLQQLRSDGGNAEPMREFAVKQFGPKTLLPHPPVSKVPKAGRGEGGERQPLPNACVGCGGVRLSTSGRACCRPPSASRVCHSRRWASATSRSATSRSSAPSWNQPVSRSSSAAITRKASSPSTRSTGIQRQAAREMELNRCSWRRPCYKQTATPRHRFSFGQEGEL